MNKLIIQNGFNTIGDSSITGSLSVSDDTTITGSAIISGSLQVTGSIYTDSTIYSPFTIGLDFDVVETFIYRAPYNFKITSTESDPSQSIDILYQASGSTTSGSYSFGNAINKFDKIHITPVSESLVILYSEKI